METTHNIELRDKAIKEMAEARVGLLHSLGRPAVDAWDTAGQPLPVSDFRDRYVASIALSGV